MVKNNKEKIQEICKDLKVIYSDVDGTVVGPGGSLFATAEKEVTLHPARSIIKIIENNIDLVLVSGRSRRQLLADTRILGFKNCISELGCQVIHDLGKKLYKISDKIPVDGSLHQSITDSGAPGLLLSKYKGKLEYHTPWSEGRECTHVFRGFINLEEAKKLLKDKGFKDLSMIDNGIIHRKGTLQADMPEIHAYHLLPKTASKEAGIRKDIEVRKMTKNNAIAIGDALSDITMADDVAALFIVSNALTEHSPEMAEKIKSYQNVFITSGQMGIGFAEIIYSLLGF